MPVNWKSVLSAAAIAVALGSLAPDSAKAYWWAPPPAVVFVPPRPFYYAPGPRVVYAPYPRPYYAPYPRPYYGPYPYAHWVGPHYDWRGVFIPGHWA